MKISAGFQKIALSVMLFACSNVLPARDLGVAGPVYPITEQDMLVTIEQRLKSMEESGELARYQAYVEHPKGVHLPRAKKTRIYYVDPSLTVPYDIRDHEGRLFHPAGTTVDPLDYITLSKRLLCFDGDDPAQVEWVRSMFEKNPTKIKPILTNGPILALMKEWQARLHLDQRGQLVERLGIQGIPAVVEQDGKQLRVEERFVKHMP